MQTALSSASSGDEIWVAAGTYKPTTGADRAISFTLKNGVAMYGGFAGGETALIERDPEVNIAILSGDIGAVGNNSDNSYHVVTGSGTDNTAILDGFTIAGGNTYSGGGMYNLAGSPTLTNVTFSDNTATAYGGGMYNYNSNPTLTNVTFSGNTADSDDICFGGGMYNYNSNPTLTNVTFNGNHAVTYGGGMSNWDSSPTLTNVTFSGNTTAEFAESCYPCGGLYGGGMDNYQSSPTLTNVTFSGNTGVYGGGMANNINSNPTLTNVTFSGNTALGGGGMFNGNSSNPTLTNVTFSGNTVSTYGGGMFNDESSNPTLTNATFSGNTARDGGGMYNNNSSNPTLTNVTFSGNTVSTYGGGMYNGNSSSPTIRNTIFWGNTAPDGRAQVFNEDNTSIINNSVVQGGCPTDSTCSNIITTDPVLGTLGDYGGSTQTIPLLFGSSAIDTGDDANCSSTDQRGIARPQGAHCDIGAYEAQLPENATLVSPSGDIGSNYTPTYTWNEVPEATWYYLWVNGPSGNVIKQWYDASVVCGSGTCSVTPTKSLAGGNHTWWVQTWNSAGYGPWSSSMTFSTTIPTPPAATTLVSPTGSISDNTPTYSWNEVAGATWYYLYVNGPSGNVIKKWYTALDASCGGGTCSVTPTTELGGGTHTWWVQTYNSAGYGPWSAGMTFSTPIPWPGQPTLNSPNGSINDRTPTYSWNTVSSETGVPASWYQVTVSGPSGVVFSQWFEASAVCSGGICSANPSTLLSDGNHTFWVRGWNAAGNGPWSNGMSFTVSP